MKLEDMLLLKEGLSVIVSPAAGLAKTPIYAKVRGICTTPLPVIGRNVIIEPEFPLGDFSCHSAFEVHLTVVDEVVL